MRARTYVAETINRAYGNNTVTLNEVCINVGRLCWPPLCVKPACLYIQVIAVSAMEAIGLDATMEHYHALDGVVPIPYANVRGMSNQLHGPVRRRGNDWVYGEPIEEDYVDGYKYAIATSSTAVLTMYRRRCLASGRDAKTCDFKVVYP